MLSLPLLNAGKQVGCRHDVPSVKLVPKMAAIIPSDSAAPPGAKLPLFTMPFELMVGPEGDVLPDCVTETVAVPIVRIAISKTPSHSAQSYTRPTTPVALPLANFDRSMRSLDRKSSR